MLPQTNACLFLFPYPKYGLKGCREKQVILIFVNYRYNLPIVVYYTWKLKVYCQTISNYTVTLGMIVDRHGAKGMVRLLSG